MKPARRELVTNKTAAIRYARALLDVAVKEHADLELIESELSQFADLFKQYPLLEKVLLNPAVPVPRKRAAVAELLAQAKFTPIVSKLLALLADRDRLVLVPDLRAAYSARLLDFRGVVRAEVTTALPLDAFAQGCDSERPGDIDRAEPCCSPRKSTRRSSAASWRASAAPCMTAASRGSSRK